MRDNVVESPPYGDRSSTGVTPEGALDVRRIEFFGTWRGLGQRRTLNDLNQSPGTNGISLFTRTYGPATPVQPGVTEVVISPFPPTTPNTDLVGPVVQVASGGGTAIPQGGAVLVARGTAGQRLLEESPVGTFLTAAADLPARVDRRHERRRRRPGARPQRRPRLPRPGGVHLQPARAAQPAHRRRPARRRPGADGRHRRPPARLQRRDDELRARPDDGAARRGHRLGLRRRRLVLARLRREAAQPPVRPRRRAAGLERAPAHVLRRLRAGAGAGDLAERRRLRREAARALVQGRPALERDRDPGRARRRRRLHRDAAAAAGDVSGRLPARTRRPDRRRARRRRPRGAGSSRSRPPTTSRAPRRRRRASRSTTRSASPRSRAARSSSGSGASRRSRPA